MTTADACISLRLSSYGDCRVYRVGGEPAKELVVRGGPVGHSALGRGGPRRPARKAAGTKRREHVALGDPSGEEQTDQAPSDSERLLKLHLSRWL